MTSQLSARLRAILDEQNLTIYGAAQIVGAETDESIKTIHERISAYLRADPKSLRQFVEVVEALGYQVKIEPHP